MRRRLVAALALLALVALAGCGGLLGGGPSQAQLTENATYDWEDDATVSLTVNRTSFSGVYDITNTSELSIYQTTGFNRQRPVSVSAVYFRYPNGTVVDVTNSSLAVSTGRQQTHVTIPGNGTGTLAFQAPRQGVEFSHPFVDNGSYLVKLPPDARVSVPVISHVSPGGYEYSRQNDRVHLRWTNRTDGSLTAHYYFQRDLLIFGGVVLLAVLLGGGGMILNYRSVRKAKRRREEVGLDVDTGEDDDDGGPPPGLR